MERPEKVSIVGAGLVGTLLATMLTRRGYKVSVYEKRPDLRRVVIPAGRSINLALAERGIHALRIAGLMDQVEPLLIPMRGRQIHDLDGSEEFLPYGQREHEVIYSVSRAELNRLMMNAMDEDPESTLYFERELVGVDFRQRQLRLVCGAQEQLINFDVVIAADGGGSVLRQCIAREVGGEDRSEMLDHDYKELNIPAAPGGGFQIKKEALHIWPRGGFMLIALPNLDGSFTVTLFLPKSGNPSFQKLQTKNDVRQFFGEYFPDAVELMPDVCKDFFENPTGELGTVRCWPWLVPERALLMGDAAHAIVPFHGQGMNCGFEDCVEFIRLLDQHQENWSAAMEEFQVIRKPNADAIATMALDNYIVMRDSVRDPKFQLKKEIGFQLERQYPDRFIPRYSMVMFHRYEYHDVLRRGAIQQEILDQLALNAAQLEQVDWQTAASLVEGRLDPLPQLAGC